MTSATFRHPSQLAVTVAQVDQMSGGRVELGLGAGWWERENAATGIELPGIHERFDRLAQQLKILDGLWSAPVGETYSIACERIGRDPSSLRRSTVQTLCAGDAVADRELRAVRIGVPLSELEGLIGDESDIRRRVADFETAGVDRLYVEILDLADLSHLDYFASAVGLTGAARDDVEPVQTE